MLFKCSAKVFAIRLIIIFCKVNLPNKILFILLNISNVSFYELYIIEIFTFLFKLSKVKFTVNRLFSFKVYYLPTMCKVLLVETDGLSSSGTYHMVMTDIQGWEEVTALGRKTDIYSNTTRWGYLFRYCEIKHLVGGEQDGQGEQCRVFLACVRSCFGGVWWTK